MIRLVMWLIIIAILAAFGDLLSEIYTNARTQSQVQTQLLAKISDQLNEPKEKHARLLAKIYYTQAQLDLSAQLLFGTKTATELQQAQTTFLSLCIPTESEIPCRQRWIELQTELMNELLNKKDQRNQRQTPV